MKLSIVALSSVIKCSNQKNVGHLKNNKNSSHSKRNKEDIEKGENEKQKVQETLKMFLTIKFLTIFLYIEKDIFCSKTYFGNLYLKWINETPTYL